MSLSSAQHVITGAIPTLRAHFNGNESPRASVRRIGLTMVDAARTIGDPELLGLCVRLAEAVDMQSAARVLDRVDELWRARPADPAQSATILIVEDDRLTARIHSDLLAAPNRVVIVARDSSQAEIMLRDHAISIVLLDLVLPDGDGRDLLYRIRTSDATRGVPILVLTSRSEVDVHAECFALGADALIVKPAAAPLLQSTVAALLHQAAERRLEGRSDRLTGLANRVAFMESLERAVRLGRRRKQPLAIGMIDLDHFKSINDRYGHAVGDDVLRETARTIMARLRMTDMTARWGGEEFCAFFPDTDLHGAELALLKALEGVRALQFEPADHAAFGVTFSAGLSLLGEDYDIEKAIAEADRLLYLAKAAGRNRILSAEQSSEPPRPRVLLVEDDEAVAGVVGKILRDRGFTVVHYTTGEIAIEHMADSDFALALLDVNLPGVSGFDVVAAIRSRKHMPDVPIVMLTGSEEETDIVRGFELGVDDYITKPFYPTELLARIDRLLTS